MGIKIEASIQEVIKDNFKGYFTIGEGTFNYEINFPVPLQRLKKKRALPAKNPIELRLIFPIYIKRENQLIDLDDDEHAFFVNLLVNLFYDVLLKTGYIKSSKELKKSFSAERKKFSILNRPKFDCQIQM